MHWLFNGRDLAECSIFNQSISCTVTWPEFIDRVNVYISSTLTINSVQADNAGQYTCYCSYNTSLLNVHVNGVQVIESDHESAILSVYVQSSTDNDFHSSSKNLHIVAISGTSSGIFIIIVCIIFVKFIHYKFHHKNRENITVSYSHLERAEEGNIQT